MEMVDTFVARLYSEIEGTPGPVTNTTKEGEEVYQNVPKLFDPKKKKFQTIFWGFFCDFRFSCKVVNRKRINLKQLVILFGFVGKL